jgi:hypothetical protein
VNALHDSEIFRSPRAVLETEATTLSPTRPNASRALATVRAQTLASRRVRLSIAATRVDGGRVGLRPRESVDAAAGFELARQSLPDGMFVTTALAEFFPLAQVV